MDAARHDRIQAALWPPAAPGARPLGVWAVLDGARDPRMHVALIESRLEYRCLFAGVRSRELEMASPQLVELLPGHRFTNRLLDEGWGQSWGIFMRIDDPANLRPHLRTILRVQDEAGKKMLFRYYDPRVLRVYLPTCTPDELRQVFGPVDSIVIEGDGGAELLDYRRRNGLLHRSVVPVPEATSA